jgi:hypothetical protein
MFCVLGHILTIHYCGMFVKGDNHVVFIVAFRYMHPSFPLDCASSLTPLSSPFCRVAGLLPLLSSAQPSDRP